MLYHRRITVSVAITLIFLAFALPASAIDIRSYRIPDLLVFPCFAAVFIFLLCSQIEALPNRVAAALLSALFFFMVRRCANRCADRKTGSLGLGDVKFAALVGLCCGLPWACAAFLVASLSGIAFILIARRGAQEQRRPIPFAPFLSAGVLAALLLSKLTRFF
jgi:prepilin signal peptidase PulO-like enzyme (type II secretory pathway)